MPFNKETKPEKRESHPIEQYPQKDTSAVARKLGNMAIKDTSKDKPKK